MDDRRKRLLFRSHYRGTKETDLFLGQFAEHNIGDLSDEQVTRLEALLEENDNDLFNWITGREPVPAHLDHDVMDLLKRFRYDP